MGNGAYYELRIIYFITVHCMYVLYFYPWDYYAVCIVQYEYITYSTYTLGILYFALEDNSYAFTMWPTSHKRISTCSILHSWATDDVYGLKNCFLLPFRLIRALTTWFLHQGLNTFYLHVTVALLLLCPALLYLSIFHT